MDDEFAGWCLVGGRRLQFYATDDEIGEWLREMLPPSFAPYTVLGREWREGRWQAFEHQLEEIVESFTRHRAAIQWIRSNVLSPALTADDEKRLSFSGLIGVELGHERGGRRWQSSIAMVDRIRREAKGQERRHAETCGSSSGFAARCASASSSRPPTRSPTVPLGSTGR